MDSSDGYIYILRSPSSNVKKIGFTQRDVTVRLKEWRKSCPSMDYKLQSWLMCRRVKKTERLAHRILAKKRLAKHACIDYGCISWNRVNACAVKAILERFDLAGKVRLLGTPAEEAGEGEVILMNKGVYKDMDVCLMYVYPHLVAYSTSVQAYSTSQTKQVSFPLHVQKGPSLSSSLAVKEFQSTWVILPTQPSPHGKGSTLSTQPVLAYNNVNAPRQQRKPNIRVNGVFEKRPNQAYFVA
ncbi:hypothetical protein K435DRAFT_854459 [Dendrothele bispora CBS 962.96]|uniref:Bacteriophage T5 Orf172 DNA-binding domain-containing protein n=1 Tax=Dendrothele bispora (strain CBS 962.96) TaxID=1314807 RepID=A0A4S8MEY9_DENBC|nr:hypothetical protein K435DRAFT_854459 [Dendrothele bispora CBS 962.96]